MFCIVNIFTYIKFYTIVDLEECSSDPCINGAVCIDGIDRFICFCPPGFYGIKCEQSKIIVFFWGHVFFRLMHD